MEEELRLMRILFYISGAYPEGMAAARRVTCYAKGLVSAGNNVEIICYHKVSKYNKKEKNQWNGLYEGLVYHFISGKQKSSYKIKRAIDWYFLDGIRMFIYALYTVNKDDIVHVYGYNLIDQICILAAVRIKKAKVIKETCEHPSSFNPDSLFDKLFRWFEYRLIMPRYDGFVAISKELVGFCNHFKRTSAKTIVVPILVEKDDLLDYSNMTPPCDDPYLLHTGTMYDQKDGITMQLQAFAKFKGMYPECKYKFIFAGPQSNERCPFIPLMKKLNIFNDIILAGILDSIEIKRYQHFCTAGIIYRFDNLQNRCGFSTKSGEMLMSGHPIIITTIGDGKDYLENRKSAYIINPNDEDALIDSICDIYMNKEKADAIGKAGREAAISSFDPIFHGKRLSEFYNSL